MQRNTDVVRAMGAEESLLEFLDAECKGEFGFLRGNDQDGAFGKIAFAAKPILHGAFQCLQGNQRTNFHAAVGHGKGIVKNSGIGEIPHGKAVQPLQRARQELAILLVFHTDFMGKHRVY